MGRKICYAVDKAIKILCRFIHLLLLNDLDRGQKMSEISFNRGSLTKNREDGDQQKTPISYFFYLIPAFRQFRDWVFSLLKVLFDQKRKLRKNYRGFRLTRFETKKQK